MIFGYIQYLSKWSNLCWISASMSLKPYCVSCMELRGLAGLASRRTASKSVGLCPGDADDLKHVLETFFKELGRCIGVLWPFSFLRSGWLNCSVTTTHWTACLVSRTCSWTISPSSGAGRIETINGLVSCWCFQIAVSLLAALWLCLGRSKYGQSNLELPQPKKITNKKS